MVIDIEEGFFTYGKDYLNYICRNYLVNAFHYLPPCLPFFMVHFDVAFSIIIYLF